MSNVYKALRDIDWLIKVMNVLTFGPTAAFIEFSH